LDEMRQQRDRIQQQLAQTQADLEKYFTKHQESQAELEAVQLRFEKLLARVPGFIELDSVEIEAFGRTAPYRLDWCIKGLEVAGRVVDEVRYGLFIEGQTACLIFERQASGAHPFVRWPGGEGADTVVVTAVGDEQTGPERARVLQTLSTSDWQLVKTLNALMIKELQTPQLLTLPKGLSVKRSVDALQDLTDKFEKLPKVFHFDDVTLENGLATPEHEYLWFAFKNVSFGQKRLARFGFRFSTVNIPAGDFGSNPRLEFYEADSSALFDGWFDESSDDHGRKLELRFARPASMDLDVWSRITPDDRELVMALIAELPLFVQAVRQSGASIDRDWQDWIELADSVHAWALLHHHHDGLSDEYDDAAESQLMQADDEISLRGPSSRRSRTANRGQVTPKRTSGRLSRRKSVA